MFPNDVLLFYLCLMSSPIENSGQTLLCTRDFLHACTLVLLVCYNTVYCWIKALIEP